MPEVHDISGSRSSDIDAALGQATLEHRRRKNEDKKFKKKGGSPFTGIQGIIKVAFLLAGLGVFILVTDGSRRDTNEFYASLNSFVPKLDVHPGGKSATVAPKEQMPFKNADVVNTKQEGTATIAFPDGSAVFVEPSTRFEVRLIDYQRDGKRDRSFVLRSGSVFSRISKFFGARGQTLICTPNAVAAARGTGYSVTYDTVKNVTVVDVVDGKVGLRNAGGRIELHVGDRGIAKGNDPPVLVPNAQNINAANTARFASLRTRFTQLSTLDAPPSVMRKAERSVMALLDPALQKAGITAKGFNMEDNDAARRMQAQVELRRLGIAFAEHGDGESPAELNPVTLAELEMDAKERNKVLDAFAGNTIDEYKKQGANGFAVRARARDRAGTEYEVTENGVTELDASGNKKEVKDIKESDVKK